MTDQTNQIEQEIRAFPDPLFGARATHSECGEGIVTSYRPSRDGEVQFIFRYDGTPSGTLSRWVCPSDLTFHTPDHPEYLETEEDYHNALDGTVVAAEDRGEPFLYLYHSWRGTGSGLRFSLAVLAGTRRRVLRWGWEA